MSGFKNREEGFEAKFVHDETMRFRVMARRNRLLAQWAAGLLGLSGADADAYVDALIKADLAEPGHEDVFRKLRQDFDAKKVQVSDHQIRRTLEEKLAEAQAQVVQES